MKKLLSYLAIAVLLLLIVLSVGCSNDLTVKQEHSHIKLKVTDFDKVYKKGDTVTVYTLNSSGPKLVDFDASESMVGYKKAVVLEVN